MVPCVTVTVLEGVKRYLIAVSIRISLTTNGGGHLLMCLLAICISILHICLLKSFALFYFILSYLHFILPYLFIFFAVLVIEPGPYKCFTTEIHPSPICPLLIGSFVFFLLNGVCEALDPYQARMGVELSPCVGEGNCGLERLLGGRPGLPLQV
jgi:hypothetical protein